MVYSKYCKLRILYLHRLGYCPAAITRVLQAAMNVWLQQLSGYDNSVGFVGHIHLATLTINAAKY